MIKRAVLIALCLAGLISTSGAQETLYVATGSKGAAGVLYTVNPLTAAFTQVAPILAGGNAIGMTGLAFDPLNSVLYGITGFESPNSPRSLVTINPTTGAATIVGTLIDNPANGAVGLSDISFRSDGTLFGIGVGDELYTINLASGALTLVGSTGNQIGGGLAFNSSGALYAARAAAGSLDTLDPSTGARTVGPTMTNAPFAANSPQAVMNALAFNGANVLYGSNSDRAQNGATSVNVDLVTINTSTGVVTNIGALPVNIDAIAFGPAVPEPSSILLLGVGAGMGWFLRRRAAR
jgi:hypothetical protein